MAAGGGLRRRMGKVCHHEKLGAIREHLPGWNFITVHYAYFIISSLLGSVIVWLTSRPAKSVSYVDSLFLVVSAITESGLNTVNLSQLSTFQQVWLWLCIIAGSAIFVSIATVNMRKSVFESEFRHIVRRQREMRAHRRSLSVGTRTGGDSAAIPRTLNDIYPMSSIADTLEGKGKAVDVGPAIQNKDSLPALPEIPKDTNVDAISFSTGPPMTPTSIERRHPRTLSFVGVGANPNATAYRVPSSEALRRRIPDIPKDSDRDSAHPTEEVYPNYLTKHNTSRNGQFFDLTRQEREHLGGVEYRAIKLLSWFVPFYFVAWQLLGALGLGAYMAHNKAALTRANGINPWWVGIFNAISAFNNSGMSLLDANMIPFQTSTYTLITMGLLILAGNTAYPLFLRLSLWSMLKISCATTREEHHTEWKATLRFVLKYPRRVYTNLFPSRPTWWLLFMVVALNSADWAAFELLNLTNKAVTSIPHNYRVLDGLFQALAVRSGGFYVISIPSLHIGTQVLYVIMMYISVYPVVITMRHSNVYEERSLGIYADEKTVDDDEESTKLGIGGNIVYAFRRVLGISSAARSAASIDDANFVRHQIRGQLAHDLWWLVLAVWLVSCIEVGNFDKDPVTYSVFNIIFEVVSAYGCVGISTGLPDQMYSFSGGWHTVSKLILCAVMLRGRHRGLPVALDRAVRLPGIEDELGTIEEEDRILKQRPMSRGIVK
ncbi:cation transport protein-domain-containing protein [Xylogone sp. PMI_703]|nr:cation transport protein-domain-containing protein [Xylogone sp. PMI_703]